MQDLKTHIVTEARSWVGTRFHHQGRVKQTAMHKGGCDCIGLIIGVADSLLLTTKNNQLIKHVDCYNYGRIPRTSLLESKLDENLRQINPAAAGAGDMLLFAFDYNPQHVAIISEYLDSSLAIIHAYAKLRCVVEHRLDDEWRAKIIKAYSLI